MSRLGRLASDAVTPEQIDTAAALVIPQTSVTARLLATD